MKITFVKDIKGRQGESQEWIILGGSKLCGKIHRVRIDWQGHRNTMTPTPRIMRVGHLGRIISRPYWFWVVEEVSPEEFNREHGIFCEICREKIAPKSKH